MRLKLLMISFLFFGCAEKTTSITENILKAFSSYKIEVIEPSSKCDEECDRKLKNTQKSFANITVNVTKNKISQLKDSLLNPKNDIVWALRGGYGAANVIHELYSDAKFMNTLKSLKNPPIVIGYSDITVLHLFLSQEFGWKTFHGPTFREMFKADKFTMQNFTQLKQTLNGKNTTLPLQPINALALHNTKIIGKITGGNLSIIQTSIGTRWQIKSAEKILFLEDWNETPQKILRMLYHLKMAGVLSDVKAIIFGDMCDNSNAMKKQLKEFAFNVIVPVYVTDYFGHCQRNYSIVYNAEAEIKLNGDIAKLKIFSR